jgi:enamine deaminase RidA (YjgF/YER057c/UK114 family)
LSRCLSDASSALHLAEAAERVALEEIRMRWRRRLPWVDHMSTGRILVSSGTDFESTVGYSRAVRVGPHVAVAGTTGPGTPGDVGGQTREALRRTEIALNEAGAVLSDVIRTRIYVTDRSARRPPWWKWRRSSPRSCWWRSKPTPIR